MPQCVQISYSSKAHFKISRITTLQRILEIFFTFLQSRKMRSTGIQGFLSCFISALPTISHTIHLLRSQILWSLIDHCKMIFLSALGTPRTHIMKASCYLLKKFIVIMGAMDTTRKRGWELQPEFFLFMVTYSLWKLNPIYCRMLDIKIGPKQLKTTKNKLVQGIQNELITTLYNLTGSAIAIWAVKK